MLITTAKYEGGYQDNDSKHARMTLVLVRTDLWSGIMFYSVLQIGLICSSHTRRRYIAHMNERLIASSPHLSVRRA